MYNAVDSLERTMLSVLGQTYDNVEYIVLDGGSTDGTVDVIRKYSDRLTHWVSEPDKGIYDAMNKGICKAAGEWILFMNAGDSFCNPDVLQRLEMERVNDDVSVVYGDSISVYGEDHFHFPAKDLETLRESGMAFCHQAVFVRRSVLLSHPFDLSYRMLADYNLFRTLFLEGVKFEYKPIPVCIYGVDGGFTDRHQWLCRQELNRILQRKDSFASRFYFALKNIIRRFLRPCNQFLRRCKYKKNLIPKDQLSQFIY